MLKPSRSSRIIVKGRVELGATLKKRQTPAALEQNSAGRLIRDPMGQRIEYNFLPKAEVVEIVDQGLVTGFGIFGAPGTGKTHLVLQILHQLIDRVQPTADLKFGGLILDPKGALLSDVAELWDQLGNRDKSDLVVLKPDFLLDRRKRENAGFELPHHPDGINIIDSALAPNELGRMLVLAAQSAGVSAKEPFWFLAWTNLFSAALTILEYEPGRTFVPTLRDLMNALLQSATTNKRVKTPTKLPRRRRVIEVLAEDALNNMDKVVDTVRAKLPFPPAQIKADLELAATQIESFFTSDYVPTLESFITNAYGPFQQHRFSCLSRNSRTLVQKYGFKRPRPSFYDQIAENGKIVLVSVGPEDPGMGKVLCTLVKCLFQQSVMSRLERYNSGKLTNFSRPVFIACDEYAEIASEVPGQPMGDGRFFSLSRQNGCLGVLATQSVHTLENSSLAQSWKSIFSNMAAKIFMGAADNETAKQACELAGEVDWYMQSSTDSHGSNQSFSESTSVQSRPELTPYILTNVLKQGEAVAIGSLDGRKTAPQLHFFKVPERPTWKNNSATTDKS